MSRFKKTKKSEMAEFKRRVLEILEPFPKEVCDWSPSEYVWKCETDFGLFTIRPDFDISEYDSGILSISTRFQEDKLFKGFPYDHFGNTAYHGKWNVCCSGVDAAVEELRSQLDKINARPPDESALARWAEHEAAKKAYWDKMREEFKTEPANER